MRPFLLAIAIFTGILFCLTVWDLGQLMYPGDNTFTPMGGTLKGFETTREVPGLKELKDLYVSKIRQNNALAEKNRTYWLWVSFLVTAFTAASTLVSSIKASKVDQSNTRNSLVLIAIFTFLASIGNWGANQFNENRNTAIQRISKLSEHRVNFYSAYQKATDETQKAEVVQQYKNDLDTM